MADWSDFILPDWPAPEHIKAFTSTRTGGFSLAPYDSFNLGDHVDDNPQHVAENRNLLQQRAQLPSSPMWLTQVHSTTVINSSNWQAGIQADAIYSNQTHQVCPILTADCLPVMLTDKSGQQVAAIHAGWRGLLNGVIENTLQNFSGAPNHILAWLGPAIGPLKFEVGTEVFTAFTNKDPTAEKAFQQTDISHYLADIYHLARLRLNQYGVNQIFGGQHCTVSEPDQFYSYRRDHQTGRMASIIWIDNK